MVIHMKKSILVVDDEELERELLRQIFEGDYHVILAANGKEALIQLSKHYDEIVIILLDLSMPVLNGYQLLQVLHASEAYRKIPVAMVTAADSQELEIACYTMGAVSVINKPFSTKVIRNQIDNIIEMYESSRKIKETLTEQLRKSNMFFGGLIDAVSSIAEFRVYESGVHVNRIRGLTKILAEEYMKKFPEAGLTADKIDMIVQASAVHDIGKIAIPDSILLKPGPLNDEEWQIMMSHTTKGCEVLSLIAGQDDEHFKTYYDICRSHHERYDGNGYPDGLAGDNIPLSAQLVSIAHTYDSLISERVYKKATDKNIAYKMIIGGKCGAFSPKLLQCFEHSKRAIETFVANVR